MTTLTPVNRLRGRTAPRRADVVFRSGTRVFGASVIATLGVVAAVLVVSSAPAWTRFGADLITQTAWDPVRDIYGALPFIVGTLYASAIALLIATPIGILTALFLSEFAPRRVAIPLTFTIEL